MQKDNQTGVTNQGIHLLSKKHSKKKGIDMLREATGNLHKKNWIAGAIKHPGALHRELGVKAGQKIPAKTLAKATKKSGVEGKRARLAETLKSFHKGKKHHKDISMTKKEAVKEHEHLTKVLKTGKGLKGEYKKQNEELQEYKKAKKHKKSCKCKSCK